MMLLLIEFEKKKFKNVFLDNNIINNIVHKKKTFNSRINNKFTANLSEHKIDLF